MSGSAGVDIVGVYRLLTQVAHTGNEHTSQLADLAQGQAALRQTPTEYQALVIGHGILSGNPEDWVRRIG